MECRQASPSITRHIACRQHHETHAAAARRGSLQQPPRRSHCTRPTPAASFHPHSLHPPAAAACCRRMLRVWGASPPSASHHTPTPAITLRTHLPPPQVAGLGRLLPQRHLLELEVGLRIRAGGRVPPLLKQVVDAQPASTSRRGGSGGVVASPSPSAAQHPQDPGVVRSPSPRAAQHPQAPRNTTSSSPPALPLLQQPCLRALPSLQRTCLHSPPQGLGARRSRWAPAARAGAGWCCRPPPSP